MRVEHHYETRVERAFEGAKRRSVRRMVRLPGSTMHAGNDEGPEMIAKRIQLAKMERRVKRNG